MTAQSKRRLKTAIAALVLLALGGTVFWYVRGRPPARAARLLAQARSARSAGDDENAERLARAALDLNPELGEAGLLAARSAVARKEFQRAAGHLARIASADRQIRLHAALLAADLCDHKLHRLGDAERAYRAALEIEPDDVDANEALARLLGLCARTREAIPYALRVLRQEQPTDLLVLLARVDGVVNDPAAIQAAREAAPDDPNPLLGAAWHAASADQIDQAIGLLREAIARGPALIAPQVALGKRLLDARRFDELTTWNEQLPRPADEFPETWLIRARMAENTGDAPAAIRCYWESLRRAPESKTAAARLARLLAEAGKRDDSERFAAQVRRLQALETVQNRVLFSSDADTAGPLLELAEAYEAAGRLWEAFGWCRTAVQVEPDDARIVRYLHVLRRKVEGLPLQLTVDGANAALAVDLSSYPLPHLRGAAPARPSVPEAQTRAVLSFRDDAASAGLRFRYDNGAAGKSTHRMFEFTGGGIAVLDFDLDGYPDVFFTQGCPWPPQAHVDAPGDQIFWNRLGTRFENITASAGIRDAGFGQGSAVGDFNADGFPDLYAAHIGANRLWQNNGDGTFGDATRAAGVQGSPHDWTTSCLLADLNGDGLPDIYAANYVTGDDVFERVCRHPDGTPRICMPFDFQAQADRLWINAGDRSFTDAGSESLAAAEEGKGLGLAAWDAFGAGRLNLLVANDTTPNFFFVAESAADGRDVLRDRSFETGLAVDGEGKAKGCMGIALGDLNDDGRLDVHVTNFLHEASTLYLSGPEGAFEDRTRETGLFSRTTDLLGFGTQFLDADLDGRLELFMSSGHIDDFSRQGKPYRMPARLFRWEAGRFVEAAADELGPYFREKWLGRSVVRIDWNRDGRDDLVIGHLADDAALLTNTTPASGRYLALRLFGVASNRDAIGTSVEVRIGGRKLVRQVTAGDGYQASNERRLIFGLGNAGQADEITVRWPTGTVQHFSEIPASGELWLVEGRSLEKRTPR